MRTGKLKCDPDLGLWFIETEDDVIPDLDPFYLEIAIKVFENYHFCELIYDEKEANYYADFLKIVFYLSKSCIYEIKFRLWEEEMIPF